MTQTIIGMTDQEQNIQITHALDMFVFKTVSLSTTKFVQKFRSLDTFYGHATEFTNN